MFGPEAPARNWASGRRVRVSASRSFVFGFWTFFFFKCQVFVLFFGALCWVLDFLLFSLSQAFIVLDILLCVSKLCPKLRCKAPGLCQFQMCFRLYSGWHLFYPFPFLFFWYRRATKTTILGAHRGPSYLELVPGPSNFPERGVHKP